MADNEQAGVAQADAGASSKKKRSPVMMIAIVLIAVLVIGGVGAVTFIVMKGSGDAESEKQEEKAAEDVSRNSLGPVKMLEPFIVNLAGGRNYLKIEIGVELSDQNLDMEIQNKMPQIKDSVIIVLSTKSFDDISTSRGKIKLKDELSMRINSILYTGTIKNIYFTNFVIQ